MNGQSGMFLMAPRLQICISVGSFELLFSSGGLVERVG